MSMSIAETCISRDRIRGWMVYGVMARIMDTYI